VLRRQAPLNDQLYSKTVAVNHVHSGVAWVRGDGTYGSLNPSFAKTFQLEPRNFFGREWYKVFKPEEHARVRDSCSQMMLVGMIVFETAGERADSKTVWLDVRLVAVHDHHMRFVGHHCMIEDKTRERELEQTIRTLKERLVPWIMHPADQYRKRSRTRSIRKKLQHRKHDHR
jgi:PAS domain-containing protein